MIIFDLETNGYRGKSVLSISALKVVLSDENRNLEIVDKFSRYYYRKPGESINPEAIRVNGLTDGRISELRGIASYPEYFFQDIVSFRNFCFGCHLYIAHNVDFDSGFIPFIRKRDTFCTMKNNAGILKSKKWPKLEETCRYYKIPVEKSQLHGSEFDAFLCYEIVRAMLRSGNRPSAHIIKKLF